MSDRAQICRKKSTLYSVVQSCEVPLEDEALGLKPDDPPAQNLPGAVTDVQMTSGKISGEPLAAPGSALVGSETIQTLWRAGNALAIGPKIAVHFGDVTRLKSPTAPIQRAAKLLPTTTVPVVLTK